MTPAQKAPEWHAPAGTILGWNDGPVDRATGIRYATARRFEPPVPVPPARKPIRATSWAPACPQAPMRFLDDVVGSTLGDLPQDEDCLRVSVTVPAGTAAGESLPVMVWLHGGSYISGAGDAPFYDPRALVSEQHVIVVTVTYRIGLLGYLGDGETTPANLGLFDQIEALRWVRRNISAFGGDPDNVTAFGQSAGGDAVAHLMIARGGEGLFRRAIVQSAPFGLLTGRSRMNAAMSKAVGVVAPDATAEQLIRLQRKAERAAARSGLRGAMAFGVQYGHDPMPAEAELDEAWRAAAPSVEVLVGNTTREAALFAVRVSPLLKRMRRPHGSPAIERRVVAPLTRRIYGNGAREFVRRHTAAGGTAYRYEFSWGATGHPVGAGHIAELPLLFPGAAWRDTPMVAGHPAAQVADAGARLRAVWGDFAKGRTPESTPEAGLRIRTAPSAAGPEVTRHPARNRHPAPDRG